MTIIDLITPKCGETWIYKKYKQMKEKTVVTLLMEELDAEMKMGTKMVLNWDKYLEMEKEQIEISDEEILKAAKECVYEDLDISVGSFELGARWYREQLKKM